MQTDNKYHLIEITSATTTMDPVALVNDMVALCDCYSKTLIWNWKEGSYALLQHTANDAERRFVGVS